MDQKKQRKAFVATNKYQIPIILLTFFPPLIICGFMAIFVSIMHYDMTKVILHNSPVTVSRVVNQWTFIMVSILCLLCVIFLMWAFIVSRNLVGAFGRIIRELDEVIESKKKKRIGARPGDELANELLKRVNALIDNLPDR